MRLHHIVICGMSGTTIFFYFISQTALFLKDVIERKICFDFSYNFSMKHFSFQEELSEI